MSAIVTPIRTILARCSRCNAWITEGDSTVSITVSDEIWHGGELVSVEVTKARSVLIFCRSCSPLYDFRRVAVGRRYDEETLILNELAEEAEIEANRGQAALALYVSPESLTAAQIKGWILEQQWQEIHADDTPS